MADDTNTENGATPETEQVPTFLPNCDDTVAGIFANKASVRKIDAHLASVAGTVVAKNKAAVTASELLASTLAADIKTDKRVVGHLTNVYNGADTLADVHPLIAVRFIDDIVSDLSTLRGRYMADADTLVRKSLRASGATSDTTTSLLAQRSAIVGIIGAMSEILRQRGDLIVPWMVSDRNGADVVVTDADGTPITVVPDVSVPSAPKVPGADTPKRATSAGTSAPKVSKSVGTHYVVRDGNRKVYRDGALSLLAYRIGITTAGLDAILSDAKIDRTAPWETDVVVDATSARASEGSAGVKFGTYRIGMTVTPA